MKSNKKPLKNKNIKKKSLENFLSKQRKKIKQNLSIKKNIGKKNSKNVVVIIGFPEYALSNFDNIYESIIRPNEAKVISHVWTNNYENVCERLKRKLESIDAIFKFDRQDRDAYNTDFVSGCWYKKERSGPLSFPPNVFGQFDSARRVMEMVSEYRGNKNKVDWVFKTRFDAHFEYPIRMDLSNNCKSDQVHVKPNPYPWHFQDFAFYGNYKAMKLWGKAFYNIESTYKENGAAFNQESLWSKFWEINKVKMINHNEWGIHVIKRKEGCRYCININNEHKPYNSGNAGIEKWLYRSI